MEFAEQIGCQSALTTFTMTKALMKKRIGLLRKKRYLKTSLAVQKDNSAMKMYQQVVFEIEDGTDDISLFLSKLRNITIS